MVANPSSTARRTVVVLGLTATLLLCSALPASIPDRVNPNRELMDTALISGASPHSVSPHSTDKDSQSSESTSFFSLLDTITRPSTRPLASSSSLSSISLSPSSSPHQHFDLELSSFLETPITPRDQILHHCTTHFLALLDSEISDRLLAELSRLVMMLPVIGVETRAVMRAKVVQVMQQVSSGLTSYSSIHRVVIAAVDDAGLLTLSPGETGTRQGRTLSSEMEENPLEGDDDTENNDQDRSWFGLSSSTPSSQRRLASSRKTNGRFHRNTEWMEENQQPIFDESQIPDVTEVAMEAVLSYMAEVLTPSLVIHQLTEAIQSALYEINKVKKLQRQNGRWSEDLDSDQGPDLLGDDWVWSQEGSGFEEEDEDEGNESDARGQDEDLWDQEMELHEWDSNGRLFEDLDTLDEVGEGETSSPTSQSYGSSPATMANMGDGSEQDSTEGIMDDYEEEFPIGIQDDDNDSLGWEDDDDAEADEDALHRQAHLSVQQQDPRLFQRVRQKFQKRHVPQEIVPMEVPAPRLSKRSLDVHVPTRRPAFSPDPRLESLLTQLMGPLLTTFIDDEFPASCRRVQGELMDGILWSLDRMDTGLSDEDQLELWTDMEY